MAYKSLTELRNQYPAERNVVQSYETNNNSITYKGRFDKNSLDFDKEDIGGLSVIGGTSFNFILEIDGVEYTSPTFKTILENSLKENNPYIQKSTVSRVTLSSEELLNAENFDTREKYAEVEVTKNLKTIEEIISHIDWLVGSRQTLRDIEEYGEYNLYTTTYDVETDSGIGLEYSDAVQSGEPYIASEEVITAQQPTTNEVGKTLSTEITTTTSTGGLFRNKVTIPIRYDITNPITEVKSEPRGFLGLRSRKN